jgi:hypothetical protein
VFAGVNPANHSSEVLTALDDLEVHRVHAN